MTASPASFLTHQQIFDKALHGVRAQGRPSSTKTKGGEVTCVYRMHRGEQVLKCGVGHLIPDNVYDPAFDHDGNTAVGYAVRREDFRAAMIAGGVDTDNAEVMTLLELLQDAHDVAAHVTHGDFSGSFETRMANLAHAEGLVYTPPAAN